MSGWPSNSESVAQGQIKSYVERILRMKEEARSINTDIREIYAEAKSNGFDKTALGKLVNYVEKREKDPDAQAESEAIFDLYLSAFYGTGTPVATHTHEGRVGQPGQPATEVERSSVSGSRPDASLEDRDPRAGSNPAPIPLIAEPVEGAPAGEVEAPAKASPVPAKKQWQHSDPAHKDCLDPGQCGGFSNLGLCARCKDALEAA